MFALPPRHIQRSYIACLIATLFVLPAVVHASDLDAIEEMQDAKTVKETKAVKDNKNAANLTSEKSQKVEVKGNREYDARRFDTASKIVITQEEIARYGDTEITDV